MKVVTASVAVHVQNLAAEVQAFTEFGLHRLGHDLLGGDSACRDHASFVTDEADDVELPVFQCLGKEVKIDVVESFLRRVPSVGIFILLDAGLEDVRIPCLEARDQIPWHQFA